MPEILNLTCDHIGFLTDNAQTMIDFYTQLLGFRIIGDSMLPASIMEKIFDVRAECRFVKMEKEGFMVEFFQPLAERSLAHAANKVGMNHWGFCVEDRFEFVEKIRAQGVSVTEIDRNGRSVYFIMDPDGNRIEIRDRPA